MNEPSSIKRITSVFFVCIVLVSLVLLLYHPVYHHNFINYDDNVYISINSHVKKGLTTDSIKWAFSTFAVSNWHPVTWLSHMIDVSLFGLDAGKHHITNVIFHSVNAVLLFFVFFRTTYQLWPSFFIAALFAVHPMHVESVAWVAERKDVLSLFFMLITFLFYISYVKYNKKTTYWAAVFFFAAGLMSKPMLVTLPCLFLLFDYWPLQRFHFPVKHAVPLLFEKIPFFILSAISSILTVIAQKMGGSVASVEALAVHSRLSNAAVSYLEYIKKLFYPVDLILPYPYLENISLSNILIAVFVLLFITFMAFMYLRKRPYLIVGWLWFIGTLVPVIGIIQVGSQSMADRYAYIPYIGLYIILVFGLYNVFNRWTYNSYFISSVLFFFLAGFIYITVNQVRVWKDSLTLFSHSIEHNAKNYYAHANIGEELRCRNRISEAMQHFSEAIKINPRISYAYLGLATCYIATERYSDAMANLLKAIKLKPDLALAHYNAGYIYLVHQSYSEAAEYFKKTIELSPDFSDAYLGMGIIYYMKHDSNNAMVYLQKADDLGSSGAKEYINRLSDSKLNS